MNKDMVRIGIPVAIGAAILCTMTRPAHPRPAGAEAGSIERRVSAAGTDAGAASPGARESRPLQAMRATRLEGLDVVGAEGRRAGAIEDLVIEGDDIGDVRDLVMNLEKGFVHYALIDFDKAWSPLEKTFAFKPDEFTVDDAKETLRVAVGQAALQTAPGIDRAEIDSTDLSNPAWVGRIS